MEETIVLSPLKIDRTKLYTQKAYAKKLSLTKGRISQMVKEGKIPTIQINGCALIYEG